MVAIARGYYCPPFKGNHGVTQGEPMSPTISNVVVYAIIRNWVMVVAPIEADKEGIG